MGAILRWALMAGVGCLAGALLGELILRLVAAAAVAPPARDFSAELAGRLGRAGVRPGTIQVVLTWQGAADLELACRDPSGQVLDRQNRKVPSGRGSIGSGFS